jgi:hypothetical protein
LLKYLDINKWRANLKRWRYILFFGFCLLVAPALCAEQKAKDAFAQADKFASQEKYIPDPTGAKAHSREIIQQIDGIIDRLTPNQLVDLISLCKEKISQIPSDSHHEPYFGYFEDVQHFAISKLGKMHTPEAKDALDQVHPIISGKASLLETWDEAKRQQRNASPAK